MGWRDLGCYGSSFYETPRLDRLRQQGMLFTDAYAAAPVCTPTRASIMTGKYPATVGITNFIPGNAWGKLMGVPYFDRLPPDEHTIAQALQDGGYQTWHVGKWHLGPEGALPQDFGFEVNIGGYDNGMPGDGYFSPWNNPTLPDGPEGSYLTDRLTDEAITLLRKRDTERPFLLNLAHYAVHTPIQAPQELVEKYQAKARMLGLDQIDPFEEGDRFSALHKKDLRITRRTIQSDPVYAAMIENLDSNIGRVLDEMDQLGLTDNTLVVFTSDNGGLSTAEGSPTCNAPLCEGKGWMYEGGNREPLLIKWPGNTPANSTCATQITSPDFYPTLLEAAGLPLLPEQHVDGASFLPACRGAAQDRGAIYWHYPHYSNQGDTPACAVRSGDWKLIEHFEDQRLELFNLREDIGETSNLASQEPARVQALHSELIRWRESIEAKIPEPNADYQAMLRGDLPAISGGKHTLIVPGSDH